MSQNTPSLLYESATFKITVFKDSLYFQVIFNTIIPDHNAGVFNPPSSTNTNSGTSLDGLIQVLFGGLRRWDAVYFTHIAEHGYTYENTVAFFPLYPVSVRIIASTVLFPLSFVLNHSNIILLTSVCINLVLFVMSAETLFLLGRHVLKNDSIAFKAALLFCVNPASIFFSAPYSECLYFYLTVNALLQLEKRCLLTSVILISLSILTRSNGLLNICYFLYFVLKQVITRILRLWRMSTVNVQTFTTLPLIFIVNTVIPYSALFIIAIIPFIIYQIYCYKLYCVKELHIEVPEYLIEYGNKNNLKVPGSSLASQWCHDIIPLAYRYVQITYSTLTTVVCSLLKNKR